ncbi:MAG: Lrp/AsnC family transcriptional regulator [Candidatus Bathyarchaeota archaeon]|nr:MAG: Lrp/AsnC family transcriptional regulator [Candidatus Bathyarchaeota archaeon]
MARLDKLDLRILRELKKDGRASITHLAKQVESSRPTITNRLRRLREEGLLNIIGGLNLGALEFKMAAVGMEIKSESSRKEVLQLLSSCPRVQTIFRTPEKANIHVGIWGEDDQTINSTIESFRDFPNVEIVRTSYLGTPIHGNVTLMLDPGKGDVSPCGKKCSECHRYQNNWCKGCPSTMHYSNPLSE